MNKLMIGLVVASLQISYAAHAAGASSEAAKAGQEIRGAVEGPRERLKGSTGTKLTAPAAAADPSAYSAGAVKEDAASRQVAAPTNHDQVMCPSDSAITRASARDRASIDAGRQTSVGGDVCVGAFSDDTLPAVAALQQGMADEVHRHGHENTDGESVRELQEDGLAGASNLGNFYHTSQAEGVKRIEAMGDAGCDITNPAIINALKKLPPGATAAL